MHPPMEHGEATHRTKAGENPRAKIRVAGSGQVEVVEISNRRRQQVQGLKVYNPPICANHYPVPPRSTDESPNNYLAAVERGVQREPCQGSAGPNGEREIRDEVVAGLALDTAGALGLVALVEVRVQERVRTVATGVALDTPGARALIALARILVQVVGVTILAHIAFA